MDIKQKENTLLGWKIVPTTTMVLEPQGKQQDILKEQ